MRKCVYLPSSVFQPEGHWPVNILVNIFVVGEGGSICPLKLFTIRVAFLKIGVLCRTLLIRVLDSQTLSVLCCKQRLTLMKKNMGVISCTTSSHVTSCVRATHTNTLYPTALYLKTISSKQKPPGSLKKKKKNTVFH